jgi:hypothetical protein
MSEPLAASIGPDRDLSTHYQRNRCLPCLGSARRGGCRSESDQRPAGLAHPIEAKRRSEWVLLPRRREHVEARDEREIADRGRFPHRKWCARVFATVLADRRGVERERRLAQLVTVCDVYPWKLLRRDSGLSRWSESSYPSSTRSELPSACRRWPMRARCHNTSGAALHDRRTRRPPRSDWPGNIRFVGPCDWDVPMQIPDWLREIEQPIVLVTTSAEFQDDARLVRAALDGLATNSRLFAAWRWPMRASSSSVRSP